MKYLKTLFIPFLIIMVGELTPSALVAQPFYGYQTIGVHTWHVSISWQGKPWVGLGYQYRVAGQTFTDLGGEWRFPIDEMYRLDNHELLFGIYKPLAIKRWFTSIGVQGRITRRSNADQVATHYGLALSLLPGYAYAASLNDGVYSTLGLRLSYEPILATQVRTRGSSEKASWKGLTAQGVSIGGHLDLHHERTLGLSLNGYLRRAWTQSPELIGPRAEGWAGEGDLYLGTTYFLRRW